MQLGVVAGVAALAVGEVPEADARIEAWEAMQSVKQGLLAVSRDRFRHLAGNCIYVSFDTESGMPPPGRRGRQEVAAALQQFKPNPEPSILPTTTARSPATQARSMDYRSRLAANGRYPREQLGGEFVFV
jgi:hypothetical protein